MSLKSFTVALIVFSASQLTGQCGHNFEPANPSPAKAKLTVEQVNARYQQDITEVPKEFKKDYIKAYTNRADYIKWKAENGDFLFDTPFNDVLDEVFQVIASANPEIDKDALRIMLNKDEVINAASYGEGTIDFNLGLFTQIQNESQLAFVMCHEIAHFQKTHGNKNIGRTIKKVNSKNFKNKVKEVNKSKYNKSSKAEAVIDDLAFTGAKHSRSKEMQADKLGFEYFRNTKYDTIQAMTMLRVLDSADEWQLTSINVATIFDYPDFAFNANWIKEDHSFHDQGKQALRGRAKRMQGLKSHPDCEDRIKEITAETYDSMLYNNIVESPRMMELATRANFEIIESEYQADRIGAALYRTLSLLEDHPENGYLEGMVSKCLFELYKAQNNHNVGSIIDPVHPSMPEDYNQLMLMLLNLKQDELVSLHTAHLDQVASCNNGHQDIQHARILESYMIGKDKDLSDNEKVFTPNIEYSRFKKSFSQLTVEEVQPITTKKSGLSSKVKKKVSGIMSFSFENMKPMIQDGKVRGYYFYYKKEMKDKGSAAYVVNVYDHNLNQFATKTISGSKGLYMLEGSYNGSAFCFKMYDEAENKFMYKLFNENFNSLGSKKVEMDRKLAKELGVTGITGMGNSEISEKTIYPLEGLGFAAILPKQEEGVGYQIKFFPHIKGEKGWIYETEDGSKDVQLAEYVGQNDSVLFFQVFKKTKEPSLESGFSVLGLDKVTGEQKFQTYVDTKQSQYLIYSTFYDDKSSQLMMLGMYSDRSQLIPKVVGTGISNIWIDGKGEVTKRGHISWDEDISEHVEVSADGMLDDKGHLYLHNIQTGYDGNLYIIGEMYKMKSSMKSQFTMEDLLILQLDADFNLLKAEYRNKEVSKFTLPSGFGKLSQHTAAKAAKSLNGFGYAYTLEDEHASSFSICYKDHQDKKKGDDTIFRSLTVDDKGEYHEEEMELNSNKSSIRLMPGKPGFFVMAEYNYETQELDLRQERITYQ